MQRIKEQQELQNIKELQFLRYLCRFKKRDMPFSTIKKYFDFQVLNEKMLKLSWIKDDKVCLPDIISHAFNRSYFNSKQLKENLLFIDNIVRIIEYDTNLPIDYNNIKSLILCIYDDFDFFDNKIRKIVGRYYSSDLYIHYFYESDSGLYKQKICVKKNNKYIELTNSSLKKLYELRDKVYLYYFKVALAFTRKYEDNQTFNKILEFGKKMNNYESLPVISFWKNSEFYDLPMLDKENFTVRNYPLSSEIELECVRLRKEIELNTHKIQIVKNMGLSHITGKLFYLLDEYHDRSPKDSRFHHEKYVIYKTIANMFLVSAHVLEYKMLDTNMFENYIGDVYYIEHISTAFYQDFIKNRYTIIRQNYIVLLGTIILKYKYLPNIKDSFSEIVNTFLETVDSIGDLPADYKEIVNIVKKYINTENNIFKNF